MEPTQLLKKQHREVEGLFKKVSRARGADERRRLTGQIARRLELHTRIEEELFYPAVRTLETRKARTMIDEALEEHHVVRLVLAELPRVDPEDERFQAKMTVLQELVAHHVEEEEDEMFTLARKLRDDDRRALADRMAEMVEADPGQARAA